MAGLNEPPVRSNDDGRGAGVLGRFFLHALLVWLLAWLPLGLWRGDPDFVLTTVSRGSIERQLYQGLLYGGLLLLFLQAWWRHAPPRPGRGRARDLIAYAAMGLAGALGLRLFTVLLGARDWPATDWTVSRLLVALLSGLAVALIEEALFRGFLMGRLAQLTTPTKALLISSGLFALVHLFRPGTLYFKVAYGTGLFLLALLLGRIAWVKCSVAASAGFHAGVIWPNLLDPWPGLQAGWWSGWQGEPVSGALSWLLTALLWMQWEWWQRRRGEPGTN